MSHAPVKISWLEKARQTRKFHRDKCRENDKWVIKDTARALGRSIGSICEDLLLASWYKTHGPQLDKFDFAHEALAYIREKKKNRDLEEDD